MQTFLPMTCLILIGYPALWQIMDYLLRPLPLWRGHEREQRVTHTLFTTILTNYSCVKSLGIEARPECSWNTDENNLFIDPSRMKVVAPKGTHACRTTATSGCEAYTAMAGESFPPDVQVVKSENGWMATDIFVEWFFRFCSTITQRPLLLVYDGHSSLINLKVIDKAIEEGIALDKLPLHTTDKLQPLKVCCFRTLKIKWDKAIAKFTVEHAARQITKGRVCYSHFKGLAQRFHWKYSEFVLQDWTQPSRLVYLWWRRLQFRSAKYLQESAQYYSEHHTQASDTHIQNSTTWTFKR